MQATINAGSISGNFVGIYGSVDLILEPVRDRKVEPDEIVYLTVDRPSDWTRFKTPITIKDANSRVDLTVDTDSDEDGNQAVLTEGATGSGVSVSAAFWDATSSVISSATTVTLNTAVQTPAGAGKATASDFSYAPGSANTITFPARSVTPSAAASLAGLTITDDTVVEGPETFELVGSSALGDARASVLTIVDDDADIDLSWSLESVEEQSGAQSVTVTASFKGATSALAAATAVSVSVAGAGAGCVGVVVSDRYGG